jgi:hypothetical protein
MAIDLAEFLLSRDFRRIPLSRSGVGHFHTTGLLNGREIAVVIDTGAASTVVDLSLARESGLSLNKLSLTGGGAGGSTLELYELPGATLTLAGVKPSYRALIAMDFTHVNQSLAAKGEAPVQVILGADALQAHAAVIDYGSCSLFLKVNET